MRSRSYFSSIIQLCDAAELESSNLNSGVVVGWQGDWMIVLMTSIRLFGNQGSFLIVLPLISLADFEKGMWFESSSDASQIGRWTLASGGLVVF